MAMAASITPSMAAMAKRKYIVTPMPSNVALLARMRAMPMIWRSTSAAMIDPPIKPSSRWIRMPISSGTEAPATSSTRKGETSGAIAVVSSTVVNRSVGSSPSIMATAGADMMGGAAAITARPSTRPGSRFPRPMPVRIRPIMIAGASTSQRAAITSGRGERSSAFTASASARAKVSVVKMKMVSASSGRAAAANCGSANPTKIERAKPCVP